MLSTLVGCANPADEENPEGVATSTHAATVASAAMTGCRDLVGGTRVPTSRVRDLVPSKYRIAEVNGVTELITIVANCRTVTVDGDTRATVLSIVGVMVESPDGTGDHNVYSLAFNADNPRATNLMRSVGVTETHTKHESASVLSGPAPGTLHMTAYVAAPYHSPFTMESTGSVPALDSNAISNWWEDRGGGTAKYSFHPSMKVGLCTGTLRVQEGSPLAQILGRTEATMDGRCFHIDAPTNTMLVEQV